MYPRLLERIDRMGWRWTAIDVVAGRGRFWTVWEDLLSILKLPNLDRVDQVAGTVRWRLVESPLEGIQSMLNHRYPSSLDQTLALKACP